MSSLAPEKLLASQQAGLDASFGLAARAVEGFERLIDLNTQTWRAALDAHQAFLARTYTVRDAQEFFALQNQHAQAASQRVMAYWHGVSEISADVRGVYAQAAQDQLEKSQRNAQALVDSLASNAPAGSEAVVNAWKSAIDTATQSTNAAYEAARRAAQQVVEAAQNNAEVATQSVARAASASGKAAGVKK
jgi:phasin family protein